MVDIDKLIDQRKQLDERIKAARQKERADERKARNHALMVLGGMLEANCGGDWRAIDFARLDRLLYRSRESLMQSKLDDARKTKDATKALRQFEAWKRDQAAGSALQKEESVAAEPNQPPMMPETHHG